MNIILRGQALAEDPRRLAQEIRPLIGLNQRQAQANVNYRERVYQRFIERGLSPSKAAEKSDAAALRYAGKQHRYRAETIVNTEMAFAYNRGAHMGVGQAIANGYMGRCEMVWSTAGTNRVCSRCLELKGRVVGHTDESGVTIPPLHPRCRCTIMYQEVEPAKALRPNKPNPSIMDIAPLAALPAISRNLSGSDIPDPVPQDIERKNFNELVNYVGKLDDKTVREWYIYHDKQIHEQIDPMLPLEERAHMAFNLRNEYRTQARELMADQEKRRELDAKHPNKTWEETIADKMKRKNLTREEAMADIYQTAIKSNPEVNRKFNLE